MGERLSTVHSPPVPGQRRWRRPRWRPRDQWEADLMAELTHQYETTRAEEDEEWQ